MSTRFGLEVLVEHAGESFQVLCSADVLGGPAG